jgi:hypothetical protein
LGKFSIDFNSQFSNEFSKFEQCLNKIKEQDQLIEESNEMIRKLPETISNQFVEVVKTINENLTAQNLFVENAVARFASEYEALLNELRNQTAMDV